MTLPSHTEPRPTAGIARVLEATDNPGQDRLAAVASEQLPHGVQISLGERGRIVPEPAHVVVEDALAGQACDPK